MRKAGGQTDVGQKSWSYGGSRYVVVDETKAS